MTPRKAVLVGLNASYSHTALSLYSLTRIPVPAEVVIREFTINEEIHRIFRAIMEEEADWILFSCYIWNISTVLSLARMLKVARPGIQIFLGGPEVSFDCREWLEKHPEIDGILEGEGEETFPLFFSEPFSRVPGLWYRNQEGIQRPQVPVPLPNLATLPPVYRNFPFEDHKMYYYEASRGCPYRCSFCLSSESRLRTVPIRQVKEELQALLDANVRLVKFVDRTMNADPGRFTEILQFISRQDNGVTGFHMEIHPAALTAEEIEAIGQLRPGLVQFEIGVQSTHPATCTAIHRAGETQQIHRGVTALREKNNAHLHLDLIAGLPFEDMSAFSQSFRDVMAMRPHKLQLGFLKLLRGTELRRKAEEYEIVFDPDAPYEVLSTRWMRPRELFYLKDVAYWVDLIYNDSLWEKTLLYCKYLAGDWWALFSRLVDWSRTRENLNRSLRKDALYDVLYAFGLSLGGKKEILQDALTYDALYNRREKPASEHIQLDPWTIADFQYPGILKALQKTVGEDIRPWYRRSRAQTFHYQMDTYEGNGEPALGSQQLLFVYKEETVVVPV